VNYTIGQASQLTGLSIHTLRYYEGEGIIRTVKRNEGGTRIYDEGDIEWLKLVCCLRRTGMTILELKEFVDLIFEGEQTITQRINVLYRQRVRIQSQVNELEAYIAMVDHKIESYGDFEDN
jgi:DNA-binding transcriptional MerR regulator